VKRVVAAALLAALALAVGCGGQRRVVLDPESAADRQSHDWFIQREPGQAPAPEPGASAERTP
jgi:hypothetical protein